MLRRREFLAAAAAGVAAAATAGAARPPLSGPLCLFSKHLAGLRCPELAGAVKPLGFTGIDLTVRAGGHVLPGRAPEDLPKAVQAIRDGGIEVPMITTDALEADDVARALFSTAARLGIRFVKPGYYTYAYKDVRREVDAAAERFRTLAALAQEHGVQLGFHNHGGDYIGAAVWDIARIIDPLSPESVGYYFDVFHAVTEGGRAGWKIAAHLAAPRIKMIAVKDFYWEKVSGEWRLRICPLGQGMVRWPEYFAILRDAGFAGPISLHFEYTIPGATESARRDNLLAAAERDLKYLQGLLRAAPA